MYLSLSTLLALAVLVHGAPNTPCVLPSLNEVGDQYLIFGQDCRQYAYGYNAGSSAKVEIKDASDTVVGAYHYIDANNVTQKVNYTANDQTGFVVEATNLPSAVQDTPEVAQAKEEHAAAVAAALAAAATESATEASTEPSANEPSEDPVSSVVRGSVIGLPKDEQILFKPIISVWYPASSYSHDHVPVAHAETSSITHNHLSNHWVTRN